ncbi:MAG: type II toxin-antitoxin system Phd/YefM family antitoxin [Verrucomicrobia bacterium]|nr:type II toxin-antitoxin system Phd/YefM family antitoxin [Verrucomicrobiota bacterium]
MKTVTLSKLRSSLDSVLRLVADGEEVQITENRKTLARLVPATPENPDWSGTFEKLDDIWGRKPLPGKAGSEIVASGRR